MKSTRRLPSPALWRQSAWALAAAAGMMPWGESRAQDFSGKGRPAPTSTYSITNSMLPRPKLLLDDKSPAVPPPPPDVNLIRPISLRSDAVASKPPSPSAPTRAALQVPVHHGPLPSLKEQRASLRREGLDAPTMREFTEVIGAPPPTASASAAEAGWLGRWFASSRPAAQPAAPAGEVLVPVATQEVASRAP